MTKVVIAIDSFKGSGTSSQIANYVEQGMRSASPKFEIDKVPIADGGEGTVRCIVEASGGTYVTEPVANPFGETVTATWGLIDNQTAVIEIAEAVGLPLIADRIDVMKATSYGVGQLIQSAVARGVSTIYVGLGGSATNDGGVGMAEALGAKFLDDRNHVFHPSVVNMSKIASVDLTEPLELLQEVEIIGLSDVNNVLFGENGASYVFGPQKGANAENVVTLDLGLQHLARIVENVIDFDFSTQSGAGAAGGLGFGLMAFCGAEIKSGIKEIMKLVRLESKLMDADYVVTGEGRIDGQSLGGKVPVGIAQFSKKQSLPVLAIVGSIGDGAQMAYQYGIDLIISSVDRPMTIDDAIRDTSKLVQQAGYTAAKAIMFGESKVQPKKILD